MISESELKSLRESEEQYRILELKKEIKDLKARLEET
jgi:hypothetical protein